MKTVLCGGENSWRSVISICHARFFLSSFQCLGGESGFIHCCLIFFSKFWCFERNFMLFSLIFFCSTPMPVWILNPTFENLIMLKRLLEIKLDFLGDETRFFALELLLKLTRRAWELSFQFLHLSFEFLWKKNFRLTCLWILEVLPIHLISETAPQLTFN